jgi:hypothetical protein
VPFTSLSEFAVIAGKKRPVWFAPDETRPLLCFVGLKPNFEADHEDCWDCRGGLTAFLLKTVATSGVG